MPTYCKTDHWSDGRVARQSSAKASTAVRIRFRPLKYPVLRGFFMNKILHYLGILACIMLIASCFLPWTHYNNINETFSGYHVIRFVTGNYYGRAGIPITILTLIVLVFTITPKLWAKRANLFLSAFLFAYCIRTYFIFTNALFPGEVDKRIGIFMILILSLFIFVCSVFPNKEHI